MQKWLSRILIGLLISLTLSHLAIAQPDSLWSRTYGGSHRDACYAVQQTADGGFVLAGFTESFGSGDSDYWLIKTDLNGDSLWSRTFDRGFEDVCHDVRQTSNGGYILAGTSRLHEGNQLETVWIIRTDANGDSLWCRSFDGGNGDLCHSIHQTADSGYVFGGYSYSYGSGNGDFWLLKMNSEGDSLWSRTFGGTLTDRCRSMQVTSDGGFVMAGFLDYTSYPSGDFGMIKTDANGDSLWGQTFGGPRDDLCEAVQQSADGGYILAGVTGGDTEDNGGVWLVKTDADGDSLWARSYTERGWGWCTSVCQTADNGYALTVQTERVGAGLWDFWLLKVDPNGDSLWSRSFGGCDIDDCEALVQTTDGGYLLVGSTKSFGNGLSDVWLVKTGPDPTTGADRILSAHPTSFILSAYPNPFNPVTTIHFTLPVADRVQLDVYNISGQRVSSVTDRPYSAGTHSVPFDGSGLASGIYIVRAQAGDARLTRKLMLMR